MGGGACKKVSLICFRSCLAALEKLRYRPSFAAGCPVYLARGGQCCLRYDGTGELIHEGSEEHNRHDLIRDDGKIGRGGDHLRHTYRDAGLGEQR